MKNKKAVALLLTASMIFTMNANAFAGTKSYTVTLDPGTSDFTGSKITQSIEKVQSDNGKTLVAGTDYWIQSANSVTQSTNAGTNTIRVEYSNGDTQDVTWSINAADISKTEATVDKMTYTGSKIALAENLSLKLDNYELTKDDEYTLDDEISETDAGTYTATATGTGNFTGTKEIEWTIKPASIAGAAITVADQPYTGSAITVTPTVTLGGETLSSSTDYTVTGASATKVGTHTVTITGKGNYTGTASASWKITAASIEDATVTLDSTEKPYTGSAITVTPTVKLGTKTLTSGTDYTVTGASATKVGTHTVTITGKGNYTGTVTASWKIVEASLAGAEITLDSDELTYTGATQEVSINSVTLNDGDTVLAAGTDYEIDESSTFEATNAGTYTITITGLGNYKGSSASKTWTIDAASIESAKISLSLKGVSYDGAEHTTEITAVSWNDIELEEGTDYTVSSSSVLKATVSGSYVVCINGKGNFDGSAKTSWSIIGVEEGEDGSHVIDAGDVEEVTIPSETWTSISDEASTVVKMGEAEIKLPSNVVSDFAADDVTSVEIVAKSETKTADTVSDDYAEIGFVPTTKNVQIFTFEINLTKDDGTTEKYDFDGKYIDVAADITEEEIQELGKGKAFAYCVATAADVTLPEYSGKNSNDKAVMDMRLNHQSEYAFTAEIDAAGKVSVVFQTNAVDENGNELSVDDLEFIDTTDDEITLTTNSSAGFKVTAPYIVAPGYQAVKWICSDDSNEDATAAPGSTLQLDSSLYISDEDYEVNYKVVLKALNTVSSTTISANGHKIVVNVLTTPAYAGRKMKGVDLVDSVSVDGKYIDKSLVKVKTKGKKNVGSSVTVTLKSIKGLDKDTNKALKNTALSSATIRAISATETSLWSKKYSKEGQMIVKMKNGTPKKVWAVVPKGYKLDSTKNSIRTAKKAKMKNGFTYDSSTGYLTFDGTYATGTIKVNITSK